MDARKCRVCGVEIPYGGSGTPALYCLDHCSDKSRKKRIAAAERRADASAAAAQILEDLEHDDTRDAAWNAAAPEVLSIGLSINEDPAVAAKIVGLDIPDD